MLITNHSSSKVFNIILVTVIMFLHSIRYASSLSYGLSGRGIKKVKNMPKLTGLNEEASQRVQRCIKFLDQSAEPFTCIDEVIRMLLSENFKEIDETQIWAADSNSNKAQLLQKGGKYFFTRNRSSIVAFTVGKQYEAGNRFKIIGAHSDSPNLKVKPKSKKSANGLVQLSVETYGGGLWHTWFDRDLSLAGRVLLRNKDAVSFTHRLVHIARPILRIPNLAIHLRSAEERDLLKPNKEDHLVPILCEEVKNSLGNNHSNETAEGSAAHAEDPWVVDQSPELLHILAEELSCESRDIVDFELSLYDTQAAAVSGGRGEFLCSSRLDNLASCFVALESLIAHARTEVERDADVSLVALFDHEEVGSDSFPGAGSTLMRDAIVRINGAFDDKGGGELFRRAIARSLVLSVDMAHAIHPNYAAKHEAGHAPRLNGGIVIKSNSNQRYATNGVTAFLVREIARRAAVPVQSFVVRNDCPCGSTIGPIIASNTGVRAVDIGMPQLSMHSIREMMGGKDLTHGYDLMTTFFRDFDAIDSALRVDG